MLGDYTGIGPEQCARVLADRRLADAARLLVVGDARVLEQGQRDAGVASPVRTYRRPRRSTGAPTRFRSSTWPTSTRARFPRGAVSAESGRIAGETLAHHDRAGARRAHRRHRLRAAQQGRAACRRLEIQRRAPDVRAPHAPRGLLRRDERARQPVDVARDLARVAAHRARSDHARAHRRRRSRSPTPPCAARGSPRRASRWRR